jgi:AcrR family transcriptional regulator
LATHDAIARIEIERVAEAARAQEGWERQLYAALEAFIETALVSPAAACLAIVEIHTVGARALEHQQQTLDAHEALLREVLAGAPHGESVTDTSVKAIVAGARAVVYHHLAAGSPLALRTLVDPIHAWVLSYDAPLARPLPEPFADEPTGTASLPRAPGTAQGRDGARLGHRERIMRAIAALSCEDGYSSLSMPAIAARSGVSNQTFYEHFRNKHEAFLAVYDRVSRRALAAVMPAFQAAPDWPHAVRASLETLLEHIAAEPEFARLGLFEVLAAGSDARRRAEERAEAFTAMLTPGSPPRPLAGPPRVLGALVAGGAWGVIQHHIIHGRAQRLPELCPQLTYMALVPFVGAQQAAAVASEEPAAQA